MPAIGDTIVIAYLVGAAVHGCVVFGGCLMRDRSGLRTATALGIAAGTAWPVVVFGFIQILFIAAVLDAARYIARTRVRRADRSGVLRHSAVRRAAKNTTEGGRATRVQTAGWGITFGPILIASVHRTQSPHVLRSISSPAPASTMHCCSCCLEC